MEFEIPGAREKQSQQTPFAQLKHYWLRSIAVEIAASRQWKEYFNPGKKIKNRRKILQNKLFLNVSRALLRETFKGEASEII